jgi:hypothetical protein
MGISKGCAGKLLPDAAAHRKISAMARSYHVFGDIEGKRDVLRVECTKCDRKATAASRS